MSSKHPHIIIVGAGIVGASLAYHLSCENAHVTLLDKATQPADNATENSFAWINSGYDESKTYLNLRQEAIADWHRVENEFNGRLKINWSGSLSWYNDITETNRIGHSLINLGYPVHLVSQQQIKLLEPNLKNVPNCALFAKDEGAIDSKRTRELFIKAAREKGADVQLSNEVLSFITNKSHIEGVVIANGKITADMVVLAAGTGTIALCQSLNIMLPVNESPAILMSFHNASVCKPDHF